MVSWCLKCDCDYLADTNLDSASSTFSTWGAASSAYSHPIDITAKHEFQEINRHSFVMRSTEITITANSVDGLQGPMQEVHISSNVPNQYLDTDTDALVYTLM